MLTSHSLLKSQNPESKNLLTDLLEWYFLHKRNFPWRTNNYLSQKEWIYHTWICEVMSQQTIISVVIPKFKEFINELPSLESLANCSDEILRYLWSGLGYYARARNLRKGAQFILEKYEGQFPNSKDKWLTVPGCGPYTASIIASICFQESVPAIDGNAIRVASRYLGLKEDVWNKKGQQKILEFYEEQLKQNTSFNPGDVNQAIMDLGATICKKNNPLCHECPWQKYCLAWRENIIEECPPTKPRKENKDEHIHAFIFESENKYLVVERVSGFLKKTKGFPIFTQKEKLEIDKILAAALNNGFQIKTSNQTFKHQITHHKITGFVTLFQADKMNLEKWRFLKEAPQFKTQEWACKKDLKKFISSSLDKKALGAIEFMIR